jgi:hypothetical protein
MNRLPQVHPAVVEPEPQLPPAVPADVEPVLRSASHDWTGLRAKGPDPRNDCIYEIWINVIVEDGQDRIVTVEISGINM